MIVPSERLEKSKKENVISAGKKQWIHRDVNCKNVQLIPINATSVICEKCNATVEIPPAPLKTGQYTLDMKPLKDSKPKPKRTSMNIVETQRIHGRNKLTKHIPEGTLFRSVVYDWNCELIKELITKNGYEKSIIIIGFNLSGGADSEETLLFLHDLIDDDRLEIRIPKKKVTWHEKFFIIEGQSDGVPYFIDVNGSSNPTFHGSGKKGTQSNRITKIGFSGDYQNEKYVETAELEWKWYFENSMPYESDLFELLSDTKKEERIKAIKRYYAGEISEKEDNQLSSVEVLKSKVGAELLSASVKGDNVTKLELGDFSKSTLDSYVTEINNLGFNIMSNIDGSVDIPVSVLDSTSYTTENLPYMKIENGQIVLRSQGETLIRTRRDFKQDEINLELDKIEKYVDSIDNSHLPGIKTKMALSEYLLSGLCAPFDHLWMDLRKSKYKRGREGPQMTSYFGGAGNGKSYASQYLLKMLTSLELDPLTSDDFTEKKVRGVARNGSCMPIIFDDLKKNRITEWDRWGKFFWDSGFVPGHPHAQLIVTANDRISSQGNLGRRVREIWMEATFENNGKNTEIVESCLDNCTNIFPFFSAIVLDSYFEKTMPYEHNDPLKIGRTALEKLYKIAKRKQPEWWCKQPYNDCVDSNAYLWFDLLNKGFFEIKRKIDSFIVEVGEAPHEINNRLKTFPAHLKATKAKSAIVIENANGMINWLRKVEDLYRLEKGKPTRRMRRLVKRGY